MEKGRPDMDGLADRDYVGRMTRNRAGILYGIAFIAFSIIMAGLHWLLTGINADFGGGVVVGALLAYGLLALLCRQVRELD